jgi:hypothetical protein
MTLAMPVHKYGTWNERRKNEVKSHGAEAARLNNKMGSSVYLLLAYTYHMNKTLWLKPVSIFALALHV